MKILLAHNSLYYPSFGGGDKSNRLLMEALAERGHSVRVVARLENFSEQEHQKFLSDLSARGISAEENEFGAVFQRRGVEVHTVSRNPHLRAYFVSQMTAFDPDIIITSTDDPAQLLLAPALEHPRARVVYLIRATIAVPFGPDASTVSARRTELLRHVDSAVGVSNYVAGYARQWGGLDAIHVPISLMEPVEIPQFDGFDHPYVVMVNPCAVKGIAILLGLADRMPNVRFGAVPSWGTTKSDLEALKARPNITLIDPVENIDELMKLTRVMLVPSVWAEARSRMVVESMARGIPVLAANVGGLPEAMLGVDYLLPVNPVVGYRQSLDEHMVPLAEVPPQDVGPWQETLTRLLSDRKHYEELAERSLRAARKYIKELTAEPFERHLLELLQKPRKPRAVKPAAPRPAASDLSEAKRKLLELRLRKKEQTTGTKGGHPWFGEIEPLPPGGLRLLCLPYAGAGAAAFRRWKGALGPRIVATPVRLPGRETRIGEPFFTTMQDLVEALGKELESFANESIAFFGHSMGAAIGFETCRWLRRSGKPLPVALIASAARAPQFRLNHVPPPEPDDAQLLDELRRLEGIPASILQNPDVLRYALPVLKADARLYRHYIYTPEEPLDLPIFAYGGSTDPNVTAVHVESWAKETNGPFRRREFSGGHFYFQDDPTPLFAAIRKDLEAVMERAANS